MNADTFAVAVVLLLLDSHKVTTLLTLGALSVVDPQLKGCPHGAKYLNLTTQPVSICPLGEVCMALHQRNDGGVLFMACRQLTLRRPKGKVLSEEADSSRASRPSVRKGPFVTTSAPRSQLGTALRPSNGHFLTFYHLPSQFSVRNRRSQVNSITPFRPSTQICNEGGGE